MRLHASALAVALTAFAGIAQAAPGGLDPSFGFGGRVTTDFNLSTDIANAVALQADGKIVVVVRSTRHSARTAASPPISRG